MFVRQYVDPGRLDLVKIQGEDFFIDRITFKTGEGRPFPILVSVEETEDGRILHYLDQPAPQGKEAELPRNISRVISQVFLSDEFSDPELIGKLPEGDFGDRYDRWNVAVEKELEDDGSEPRAFVEIKAKNMRIALRFHSYVSTGNFRPPRANHVNARDPNERRIRPQEDRYDPTTNARTGSLYERRNARRKQAGQRKIVVVRRFSVIDPEVVSRTEEGTYIDGQAKAEVRRRTSRGKTRLDVSVRAPDEYAIKSFIRNLNSLDLEPPGPLESEAEFVRGRM